MTLHTGRLGSLLAAVFVFIFVSCEDVVTDTLPYVDGKGKVMLNLSPSIIVKSASSQSETGTYSFRYVGVGDYATSDYYLYDDVTWPMDWYYGVFKAEAQNCSPTEAESSYGRLRFYGISDAFPVIKNQTASVVIQCSIANIKVTVKYDNSMLDSFDDVKLIVESVSMPDPDDPESVEVINRTLEFNTLYKEGFYNVPGESVRLRYTLYVKEVDASEFIEASKGYFTENGSTEPADVKSADFVTFNVNYVGTPVVTPDIKFIISGSRVKVDNEFTLKDYVYGDVVED